MGETLKQNEQQNVVNEKIADNVSFENTAKAMEEMEIVDDVIKNVKTVESENEKVEGDFAKLLDLPGIPPVGEWFDKAKETGRNVAEKGKSIGEAIYKTVKEGVKELREFWSENAYKMGGPIIQVIKQEDVEKWAEDTTKKVVNALKTMGSHLSGENERDILDTIAKAGSNSINRMQDAASTLKLITKLNEIKDTFEGMTYTEMKNHPSYNDAVKFLKASFSIKFYGEVRDVSIKDIQSKLGVDVDGKFGPKTLDALIKYLEKIKK